MMFGPTRENGATKGVSVDRREGRIQGPCLGMPRLGSWNIEQKAVGMEKELPVNHEKPGENCVLHPQRKSIKKREQPWCQM